MPLLELWKSNSDTVNELSIVQLVTMAGDGRLTDDSICSNELRHVLSELESRKLFEHIEKCLTDSFDKSGSALQDLVNELGRRLDYAVENGLYSGRTNRIGFDGLWQGQDGHALVIEVKTTDAYRINLDTIANYRRELIDAGRITSNSSILIVVGRADTGDVEAQVRGSKHAWDIRLISIDALRKLVDLKQRADEEDTIQKIQSLLKPFEYTRLDGIIDVVFVTAKDVEGGVEEVENGAKSESGPGIQMQDHTAPEILKDLRSHIVQVMARRLEVKLIAKSRAMYWSADKTIRVCCSVSKQYESGGYWYAYHPYQHDFLKQGSKGLHVLGCVGQELAIALPVEKMEKLIENLNSTEKDGKIYYHLRVEPTSGGGMKLVMRGGTRIDLASYFVPLGQA